MNLRITGIAAIISCLFLCLSYFQSFADISTHGFEIPVNGEPSDIVINPQVNKAFISIKGDNLIAVVDLNAKIVIGWIQVKEEPEAIAIDQELNIALVYSDKNKAISIIDLNSYDIIRVINISTRIKDIAIDSVAHIAVAVSYEDNFIIIIDLESCSIIGTKKIDTNPIAITIDPDLKLALVLNEKGVDYGKTEDRYIIKKAGSKRHDYIDDDDHGHYYLSVLDLVSNQIIRTISIGKKPSSIGINNKTHVVIIANEKDGSITIVDLLDWDSYTLQLKRDPIDVGVNILDNTVLVLHKEGELLHIDLNSDSIIGEYKTNKKPQAVAVNPYTNVVGLIDRKSESLTLIQLPNPVPIIKGINPSMLKREGKRSTLEISGSGFIRSSSIHLVDNPQEHLNVNFIDNENLDVDIPSKFLQEAGIIRLIAVNPQPRGGTSGSVDVVIENPIPTISSINPLEVTAGISDCTLYVHGTGFLEDTLFYINGIKQQFNLISDIKAELKLKAEDLNHPGTVEIVAINQAPGGGISAPVFLSIKSPLEVTIVSPLDGDTINKEHIIVKGTFKADSRDIGISVNGNVAEIIGNNWVINYFPLNVGTNTITASIEDNKGISSETSVIINKMSTAQEVRLSANIISGIAPVTTYFFVSLDLLRPVANYQIDYEGDGLVDYTGAVFEDMSHTYESEGIFYPSVTVTDDQGSTYSSIIGITVLNKLEIDNLLRNKWESMKKALCRGDIETALTYFADEYDISLGEAFTFMKNEFSKVFSLTENLEFVTLSGNFAKYENIVYESEGVYSYPILFSRDINGIWRIKSF